MYTKSNIMRLTAIILAAGKGTRMKSDILKVMHKVAGRPLIDYVLDAVVDAKIDQTILVIGHQSESIKAATQSRKLTYVEQKEQLGTGHAVGQAVKGIIATEDDHVVILAGDCPLITAKTIAHLIEVHDQTNAAGTILTTNLDEPASYGRILRGDTGSVVGIREAKDCTPDQLAIQEINTGVYCFKTILLIDALSRLSTNNTQGEYYLTDVIEILQKDTHIIESYCTDNANETIGMNTRVDQAKINRLIYRHNNSRLMESGVTILDPDTTFIDSTVKISQDTVIYPFTTILGDTEIGAHCTIGPHCHILNSKIPDSKLIAPFSGFESATNPAPACTVYTPSLATAVRITMHKSIFPRKSKYPNAPP